MTSEQFRACFQPQLIKTNPCNGDYLNGRSLSEAKREYMQSRGTVTPPLGGEPAKFDVDAFFERKIQEWKDHEGERLLFMMVEYRAPKKDIRIEILKVWEGDLDSLAHKYSFLELTPGGMPRFKEI